MKIVVLDGHTSNPGDLSWDEIQALGELTVFNTTPRELVAARAIDADILVCNKVKLDSELLAQLPALKFVSVLATGYDVIDVAAAERQGIVVSNVPAYSTDSVAQLVFTGLLSLLARPEEHHQSILAGDWQRAGHFSFWNHTLVELAGKTFGIFGLGKIGRAVARVADAFGMQVVASNRSHTNPPHYEGFRWLDRDQLFAQSDVISLHCPATPETVQMVDHNLIRQMKPSAILINTARGSLIHESDLADALNAGLIGGAFLDVVSAEPIEADNPLLRARNCLLTPHLGWATIESRQRLLRITAGNIAAFVAGEPVNVVGSPVKTRIASE